MDFRQMRMAVKYVNAMMHVTYLREWLMMHMGY